MGARDFGEADVHTLELTPETYGMFYDNTFENVATVASVVDSPFPATVLARTGAITSATITSLPQNNLKKEENLGRL